MLIDEVREESLPAVGPDEPATHAICKALLLGDHWLRYNAPGAMAGEVEGVHRMRTTARRLRSNLGLFRDLIEGDWADRLALDLQWLGELLGNVRDLDVMMARLRQSAGELSGDLGPLFAALTERHDKDLVQLREGLSTERYHHLLEALARAAELATFTDRAWKPCRAVLPSLVRHTWRKLRSVGHALDLIDSDESYHEVRKRAKRCRHCAETVAAALDSDASHGARRFVKRVAGVQTILGEHQDATIACQEIRRIAADCPDDGAFNLTAGRLLEREENAASQARSKFFKAWHRLDRPKNLRWMKA